MNKEQLLFLEYIAYNLRVSSLVSTTQAESGHPTSCLSAADLVSALFFYQMHFDPHNHDNPNNDRFILSKGHAAPLLYAVWKELGILSDTDLLTLREFDSVLEGHPTPRFVWSEAATGSLGQGLSIGAGMALAAKMDKRPYRTYVLLGDSEMAEGSNWEAAELSAFYKLDNLVAIIDVNRLGQSTVTMEGYDLNAYADKFKAFGWQTYEVDGHSMLDIISVFNQVKKIQGKPSIIIAKTIKGYGLKDIEGKLGYHGKAFSKKELPLLLTELYDRFAVSADAEITYTWMPKIPDPGKPVLKEEPVVLIPLSYKKGEEVPTRKAYGDALESLGDVDTMVVSLDAEVKNSTYAQTFEDKHPQRFIQCFIAEQNMVGMAVGFALRGHVPFVSTFACFFTRAFDQLRMAAISRAVLRCVGSHAGVSIGQDGPSQMGLEDIAMFRTLPNSVVFYPSDAVSTYKLIGIIVDYHDGISYLRTTRKATPVIYDEGDEFAIGSCHVLRQSDQDVACLIGAGVTLHEALKAHDMLQKQGIAVSVIDLYCIKPLPVDVLVRMARKSGNHIVVAEDHYPAGGIGEAIAAALQGTKITMDHLAVTKLPRSGKPEKLLAYEEIDADALVHAVLAHLKKA